MLKKSETLDPNQLVPPKKDEHGKIVVDFLAGSIAGFTTTLTGHPLDTIKVRMQVLNDRFWSCSKKMLKQEGVTSFFKGVQSPLASAPICTAMSFGSYEISKRLIGIQKGQKLKFSEGLFAGGVAGFLYAGLSTPLELIKCRGQIEGTGQKIKTSGPIKIAVDLVRNEGFKGLYRGYWITCLRDIPGGAVQFGAYELLKNFFQKHNTDTSMSHFLAGGLAKFTTWFACHPQDLIKTKLQCKSGYQGITDCAKEIWNTYGSAGFWRGSMPSIVRTLISGAVSFTVYEEAKRVLSDL